MGHCLTAQLHPEPRSSSACPGPAAPPLSLVDPKIQRVALHMCRTHMHDIALQPIFKIFKQLPPHAEAALQGQWDQGCPSAGSTQSPFAHAAQTFSLPPLLTSPSQPKIGHLAH